MQKEQFLRIYNHRSTRAIKAKSKSMQQTLKTFADSLLPSDELIIQVAIFKH